MVICRRTMTSRKGEHGTGSLSKDMAIETESAAYRTMTDPVVMALHPTFYAPPTRQKANFPFR